MYPNSQKAVRDPWLLGMEAIGRKTNDTINNWFPTNPNFTGLPSPSEPDKSTSVNSRMIHLLRPTHTTSHYLSFCTSPPLPKGSRLHFVFAHTLSYLRLRYHYSSWTYSFSCQRPQSSSQIHISLYRSNPSLGHVLQRQRRLSHPYI